ncbi:DUF397 domain-containing protein [Streptomyces sp. NPDC091972]|uniref:DUF397 domain-containing protein n=1 Tax=Streptomyces sp. NPDC091972 TaxID=3366007 RepID=UPI003830404F
MGKPTCVHSRHAGSGRQPQVRWRKSSHSNPQGACLEIAEPVGGQVWFRDSKVPAGPVVAVSRPSARAFASAVADGHL